MPRYAICRCGEHGSVNVQGPGVRSRSFGRGARADLDEVVLPASEDRKAVTLADALGRYVELFEVEKPAASAAPLQDAADSEE